MGSRFTTGKKCGGWLRGLCALLLVCNLCTAQQNYPEKCGDRCKEDSDFQKPLPRSPEGMKSRVAQWSVVALNQIKANLQSTSPPGVGRALGLFSACMYEAATLFDEGLEPYAAKNFFKIGRLDSGQLDSAIDGAAHRALTYLFGDFGSVKEVDSFLESLGHSGGYRGLKFFKGSGNSEGFRSHTTSRTYESSGGARRSGGSTTYRRFETSQGSASSKDFFAEGDLGALEHLDFDSSDFYPDSPGSASEFFSRIPSFTGLDRLTSRIAMRAGSFVCGRVIEKYTADGYDGLGNSLSGSNPGFTPANLPQVRAGITDCPAQVKDLDRWQPLCVPRDFSSEGNVGTENCEVQKWLAPTAGAWNTFALPKGSPTDGRDLIEAVATVESIQGGPPRHFEGDEWEKQMKEVVDASANLDDPQKMIAEWWAAGPDTTSPPGVWYLIAVNAAESRGLGSADTAQLMMMVGSALNDAGVGCWRVKRTYDFSRPLSMVQCGSLGRAKKDVLSWKGPYQGVGFRSAATWQPYQLDTFKTPPFAGYVSGHSTFSGAAASALEAFFGSDNFVGPKCIAFEEGSSEYERKITAGQPGHISGVTDVPNKGKDTVGYAPRSRVNLCWDTFSEAADQASNSRIYGGIHIKADSKDGKALGNQIGKAVARESMKLFGKQSSVSSVF